MTTTIILVVLIISFFISNSLLIYLILKFKKTQAPSIIKSQKNKAEELSLLKEQYNNTKNDLENANLVIEALNTEINKLKSDYNFKDKNDSQLLNMRQENLNLRNTLNKMQEELKNLENDYNEKNKKLNQLLDERKILINDNLFLNQKIDTMKKNYEKQILDKNISSQDLTNYFENTYQNQLQEKFTKELMLLKENRDEEAKKIISKSLINISNSQYNDFIHNFTSTKMNIENLTKSWKGKIIGRGGAHKAIFERMLGVTFEFPHETSNYPNHLLVCNYNAYNRDVAIIALQALIEKNSFNRISIEKEIEKAQTKMINYYFEKGSLALKRTNLHINLPKNLIISLGSLSHVNSYGQNVLQHSIEVSIIARSIAKELNLNEEIAALCGLFHDIGKASKINSSEHKDHIEEGEKIIQQYKDKLPPEVEIVIKDHHNKETLYNNIYTCVIVTADSISAGRPGARKQSEQDVFERIKKIEELCSSINGIKNIAVLRSGYYLFIYVDSSLISDLDLHQIGKQVEKTIKNNINFPGTIDVTIFRETKADFKIRK